MVRPDKLASAPIPLAVALALSLALAACATGGSPKSPAGLPPATGVKEAAPDERPRALKGSAAASAWEAGLLGAIPDGAAAVVAMGPRFGIQTFRQLVDEVPALKKELSDYLDQALGIDIVGHHHGGLAVIATALRPQPQICLRLPMKDTKGRSLTGKAAGQHLDVALIALDRGLVAALVDDALLVGAPSAVRAVLDQRQKGQNQRGVRGALATKLEALAHRKPLLAASVNLAAFGGPTAAFGMRHATATVSDKLEVALEIEGDPAMMGRLPPLYAMGTGALITRQLHQKTMAKRSGNVVAGTSAIFSYHLSKKMLEDATPRLDEQGGKLTSRFKLPLFDSAGLPIIGVLAAVAIPAFIKYLRKSKTVEAREGIQQLKLGAKAFFAKPGGARKLARLKSTPWTPKQRCCQQPGNKCPPNAATFADPTFRALAFSPAGAHRYQYRVQRTGRGKALVLTIEARGDLDCDDTFSNFKLIGSIKDGALVFSAPMIAAEIE